MNTVAVRQEDGSFSITGSKMYVTNGLQSTLVFLLVTTDPEASPAHHRMTCFM